jgi:hypothetical protein
MIGCCGGAGAVALPIIPPRIPAPTTAVPCGLERRLP